jgi:hypothetical protein
VGVIGVYLARLEAAVDELIAVAPQFGLEVALVYLTPFRMPGFRNDKTAARLSMQPGRA